MRWLLCLVFFAPFILAEDCGISPAVRALWQAGSELSREDLRARAAQVIAENPQDLLAHLEYLKLYRYRAYPEIRLRYRLQNDGSVRGRLLYAASLIGEDTPAALAQLRDLDSPFADLLRGEIQASPNFTRSSPPGEALLRFLQWCPAYLPAYRHLRIHGEGPRLAPVVAALRQELTPRREAFALAQWPTLWALEFRVHPPADHPRLREQVARDVDFLAAAGPRESVASAVRQGYRLAGRADQAKSWEGVGEEAGSPLDRALQKFAADHPFPNRENDRLAYWTAKRDAARQWILAYPGKFVPLYQYFQALAAIPSTAPADLHAAAEAARASFRAQPSQFTAAPPGVAVARAYLHRGLFLDEIPQLIADAEKEFVLIPPAIESDLIDSARNVQQWRGRLIEGRIDWTELRFDYALSRQDFPAARSALAERRAATEEYIALAASPPLARHLDAAYWQAAARLATAEGDPELARQHADRAQSIRGAPLGPARDSLLKPLAALPPIEGSDLAGIPWRDSAAARASQGKVVIYNVWATWCAPCLRELPEVQKLHAELAGHPKITLVTLNADDNPGLVEPFLAKHGYQFPVVLAHRWIHAVLPNLGIPRTWVVSADGVLRYEQIGGEPGEAWRNKVLGEARRYALP